MAAKEDWITNSTLGAIGNDLTENNRSGFSGVPAGCRFDQGYFCCLGYGSYWWSAIEGFQAGIRNLNNNSGYMSAFIGFIYSGFSVRLVKD